MIINAIQYVSVDNTKKIIKLPYPIKIPKKYQGNQYYIVLYIVKNLCKVCKGKNKHENKIQRANNK